MPHPRTAALSVVWNYAGKGLEYIVQFATALLIAHALGVDGNGEFVGLISFSQLLLAISSFGLDTSLNRHVALLAGTRSTEQTRYIIRRFAAVRISLILLCVAVVWGLAGYLQGPWPARLQSYVLLLLLLTVGRSLVSLWAIALTARFETRTTGTINLVFRILELAGVGIVAATVPGVAGILTVLAVSASLQLAAYLILPALPVMGAVERLPVGPMVVFGGIFWANTIVDFFLGRHGDIALLSMLLPDVGQASLYDVGFTLVQLGTVGMTVGLSGVSLAIASSLAGESSERLDQFIMVLVRFTSMVTIPAYAFLFWNVARILPVLYPPAFSAAAGLVQGMVLFRIVGRIFGGGENADYLLARGRVVLLVGIGGVAALTNVLLDIILIPRWGAQGAMIASGGANLLVNALGAFFVMRNSTVRLQLGPWAGVSAISLAAGFLVSVPGGLENPPGVALRLATFLGLFMLGGLLLKPIAHADADLLGRIDERLIRFAGPFTRRPTGDSSA